LSQARLVLMFVWSTVLNHGPLARWLAC